MEEYPLDCIYQNDYKQRVDDGIETMRASDGSYKTHIKFAVSAHEYSFSHRYMTPAQRSVLMSFYDRNKTKLFLFTSPETGEKIACRFTKRPQATEFLRDLRTMQVELVGETSNG